MEYIVNLNFASCRIQTFVEFLDNKDSTDDGGGTILFTRVPFDKTDDAECRAIYELVMTMMLRYSAPPLTSVGS